MADSIAIARVQKELKDFQKKGGDLVGIRLGNGFVQSSTVAGLARVKPNE